VDQRWRSILDREGVLKALHACLQVVEALLLRGQQEFFDPFEAFRHFLIQCVNILFYGLDILHTVLTKTF
jgi:hypothetical protein